MTDGSDSSRSSRSSNSANALIQDTGDNGPDTNLTHERTSIAATTSNTEDTMTDDADDWKNEITPKAWWWVQPGGASAIIFHYTFHFSVGINLNHMIFLNTYLIGVLLCFAAIPLDIAYTTTNNGPSITAATAITTSSRWMIPAGVGFLYLMYALFFIGILRGLSYTPVITLDVSAAYLLRVGLLSALPDWQVVLVGLFAFSLGSLLLQLAGHYMFEKFEAKPNLFHGFIAAPILEWRMYMYKIGLYRNEYIVLRENVNRIRLHLANEKKKQK